MVRANPLRSAENRIPIVHYTRQPDKLPARFEFLVIRIGAVQRLYTTHPALLLFLITATVYTLLVLFFSRPPGMSMTNVDEPHYLL